MPKSFTKKQTEIATRILKEIRERLQFLNDVGLDYLTLSRASGTLSGGESQRIRLASQIGSGLTGVLYVLDEPSIGLHQRDNARLLVTLKHLRDIGNTVIVVEHDEDAIMAADYVVDIGPGAGVHGGQVVSQGTPDEIMADRQILTGQYLTGVREVPVPKARRQPVKGKALKVIGARENNLKNVSAEIPLGLLTCVTGVSGGGKSTLLIDTLYKAVARKLNNAREAQRRTLPAPPRSRRPPPGRVPPGPGVGAGVGRGLEVDDAVADQAAADAGHHDGQHRQGPGPGGGRRRGQRGAPDGRAGGSRRRRACPPDGSGGARRPRSRSARTVLRHRRTGAEVAMLRAWGPSGAPPRVARRARAGDHPDLRRGGEHRRRHRPGPHGRPRRPRPGRR